MGFFDNLKPAKPKPEGIEPLSTKTISLFRTEWLIDKVDSLIYRWVTWWVYLLPARSMMSMVGPNSVSSQFLWKVTHCLVSILGNER